MRLAEFILDNIEPILKQWETFARTLTPAADGLDSVGLRDHAEQMLRTIAADLQTPQSHAERILKSHGEGPELGETTAAQTHADIRQATGFTISLSTGDFAHACRSMVEEARACHPDREIILQAAPSLAGSFDRARLEQVITNLIGNAIEHGEAGTAVTVTLKAAGDDALLSVHNRGPVIDAAAKATLFSPMVRHIHDEAGKYGAGAGLGLGLYIASAIVSAHQGSIEVESTAGKGTTFNVRIPLQVAAVAQKS
ncbi:sensor histidine kinase [Pseudomonas shirazensis]|uniref:sensor histidine kinase n=1 Tax=Pseudomonas shirazensis TaxID=2745494 RepID=UPI0016489E20|nr:ATP-binding protein [Pseudomonas shirazensis]MBV4499548.1 ATP-binding protein [Pseudomonas shirazensis]